MDLNEQCRCSVLLNASLRYVLSIHMGPVLFGIYSFVVFFN